MKNNIKEIVLPDGWLVDKIENGKIILKEDDSKPVIKWNEEKNGVEVKADGYYFIVANMPDMLCDWYNTKWFCNKFNTYLPSVEELKVVAKYLDVINQCFENNDGFPMGGSYYWSSSEYINNCACGVSTYHGNVCYNTKDCLSYYRGFVRL